MHNAQAQNDKCSHRLAKIEQTAKNKVHIRQQCYCLQAEDDVIASSV